MTGILIFNSARVTQLRVGGLRLLERGIRTLRRLGAEKVLVVVADNEDARMSELVKAYGAPLFTKEQVIQMKSAFSDDVLILRGDVVFDVREADQLLRGKEKVLFLTPDRGEPFLGRLNLLEMSRSEWEKILTAIFACSKEHFTFSTKYNGFCRVAREEALGEITWELVRRCAGKQSDGFISRHLNRKISSRITYLMLERASPLTMTIISFISGIVAAVTAIFSPALGGIFFQVNSVLDGVDGEMSRTLLSESALGGWLDSLLDRYADALFLIALMYHLHLNALVLFIAVFAVFGSFMVSYTREKYRASFGVDIERDVGGWLACFPGRRDERVFLVMLLCLAGKIFWVFLLLGIMTHLRIVLFVYRVMRKKRREGKASRTFATV